MKIIELQALEAEQIELLRARSLNGDNHASQVLLEHLRAVSRRIDEWKQSQDAADKQKTKRKYTLNPEK